METNPEIRIPAALAARYLPEKLLGEGACGSVWLARQVQLGRAVALKLLHPRMLDTGGSVQRFNTEAKVTAALSHPAIVIVLDHGVDDGVPWIAYEFVGGRTLRQALHQDGPMPWRRAVEAMLQLSSAIELAHAQGVLHRDLKPANVLEADPGRYKVADFGVAKWAAEDSALTRTGALVGTPAYLAPELFAGGRNASAASDQYALGMVLYEMIVAQLPFPAPSMTELIRHHMITPPPAVSASVPGVPAAVDAIVVRAMAKKPADRYPSVTRMREELEAALAARPRTTRGSRPLAVPAPAAGSGDHGARTNPDVPSRPAFRNTFPVRALPAGRSPSSWAAIAGGVLLVLAGVASQTILRKPAPAPSASVAGPAPDAPEAGALRAQADALWAEYKGRGKKYVQLARVMGMDPDSVDFPAAVRLAATLEAGEAAEMKRLPPLVEASRRRVQAHPTDPTALRTLSRLCALTWIDWERWTHARLMSSIATRMRDKKDSVILDLAGVGGAVNQYEYPADGIPMLTVYLDAVCAEFAAVAAAGRGDVADTLDEFAEMSHRTRCINWVRHAERARVRIVEDLHTRLQRMPGPGAVLGRLALLTWERRDYKRDRKKDPELLVRLEETLTTARAVLPGVAPSLGELAAAVTKDRARSR